MRLKDYLLLSDVELSEIDTGSVGNGLYAVTPETNGLKNLSTPKKKKKRKLKPFKSPVSLLNPGEIVDESKLKLYKCYIKYFNASVADGDVVVAPSAQDVADYWTDVAVNNLFKGHTTPEAFDLYYKEHPGEFEIEEIGWDQVGEINRRALLREGGNVFRNTVTIEPQNIIPTIQDIFNKILPALELQESDIAIVGSALKHTKCSSDIDIAVLRYKFGTDYEENFKNKLQKLCSDVKILPGLGIVSCTWPISGKTQEGEFAQIDWIFTDNLEWAAFRNFCPEEGESDSPAAWRNILLSAITKWAYYEPLIRENEKVVTWQRGLFSNFGAMIKGDTIKGIDGKIRKTPKTMFTALITDNVQEFVQKLFGPYVTKYQLNTFEEVLKLVNEPRFKWARYRDEILKETKHGIETLYETTPKELENI